MHVFKAALVSSLLSALVAIGYVTLTFIFGRRKADAAAVNGPNFEILLQ